VYQCESHDELDFLFPELTRIHNHDLVIIESWQNHIDLSFVTGVVRLKKIVGVEILFCQNQDIQDYRIFRMFLNDCL
jgi:hypothetical protein